MSKTKDYKFELHLYAKELNKVYINNVEYPISDKCKNDLFDLQNMNIQDKNTLRINCIKVLRRNEFKRIDKRDYIKKHASIQFSHSVERMNAYASKKSGSYSNVKQIMDVIRDFERINNGSKDILYSNDNIPNGSVTKECDYNGMTCVVVDNKVGYKVKFSFR